MHDERYNYDFSLSEEDVRQGNSAQTKVIQMIDKETVVLECGPADGLMTRYLTDEMKCKVYIIEYDPVRYEHSMQYACGGVCANLEEDDWLDSFSDGFFDYILYVDVLEHLRDPKAVLKKMKRLLKPSGSVLLSVPNIANGDIIMNLLCDRFTYTELGLLDDTHIHFFARTDLHEMIREAGYHLAYEGFTSIPLFMSEQGGFIPENRRIELQQLLETHITRNIYQFICRLTLTETEPVSDIGDFDSAGMIDVIPVSRFYCDTGEGFSEEGRTDLRAVRVLKDRLGYQFALPEGCRAVRFDPIELRGCILWDTVAMVDGAAVKADPCNGTAIGEAILYFNEDPQLYIEIPDGGAVLRIETAFKMLNSVKFYELERITQQFQLELRDKDVELHDKDIELQENKAQLENQLAQVQSALAGAQSAVEDWKEKAAETEEKYAQENQRLCSTNDMLAQKELELENMRLTVTRLQREAAAAAEAAERSSAEKDEAIAAYSAQLGSLLASRSWKVTKPLRAIKHIFK